MASLQSFYEDMIITLLSEPHLIVASSDSVRCEKTQSVNVFVYDAEGLWIGYAIVVAFTFVFCRWRLVDPPERRRERHAVQPHHGYDAQSDIDRLSIGACLGGDPFPPELTRRS